MQLLDAWPNAGVLNARVDVGESGATDPTCAVMRASPLRGDGLPGPAPIGYMAAACVFRTALFRAVGGYAARLFTGGEEELVALDVLAFDQAIVYCEQLIVHHHPSPARDSALRRRLVARNAAWTAWLRLPWRQASWTTLRAIEVFARERTLARDGIDLLRGLAWSCRCGRVVPPPILAMREQERAAEREAAQSLIDAEAPSITGKIDART